MKEFTNTFIPIDSLPQIEEVEFEMHPKRYLKYRAVGFIIMMTLLSATWIAPLFSDTPLISAISGAIWVLLLVFIFAFERKKYRVMGFALREHDLTYKRGLFFFKQVTLPFNRIQHTEISNGPIERKFNLSSLKIFTAGGASSDLSIAGLDPERAQELKDFIAKSVAKSE